MEWVGIFLRAGGRIENMGILSPLEVQGESVGKESRVKVGAGEVEESFEI